MKVLLQRVSRAEVRVAGTAIGSIGTGLLVLLGVERPDTLDCAERFAARTAELRIFADDEGRMNRSVEQVAGEILVVSQFTLAADTRKGRRPSFAAAAPPEQAERLYEAFADALRRRGLTVRTGRFQADMDVESVNRGPVTLLLDTPPSRST